MASDDFRKRFTDLQVDLPANPIIDELQDLFEEVDTELRALRKDRERLGFVLRYCLPIELWFSADEMITVMSVDEIDAAMAKEAGE